MTLSQEEVYLLLKNIFLHGCQSILKSREYTTWIASISEADKRIIRRKQLEISEFAANYYLDTFGPNLDNQSQVDEAVQESFKIAIDNFR